MVGNEIANSYCAAGLVGPNETLTSIGRMSRYLLFLLLSSGFWLGLNMK